MTDVRTALVTGGSRGIGRELVTQLAARGFVVHTCATSRDSLAGLPDDVRTHVCDVSDPESVDAMFAVLRDDVDHLDIVINNAGVLGPRGPLDEVSADVWRHVFSVNADGPFLVTKAALPLLRPASGSLVNVSSSVGRTGRGGWGPYACSKHALEGMTDVWADELRSDGVVVFSANPGGTATDMRAEAYPDEDPDTLPSAAEVAAAILRMVEETSIDQTGAKLNCRDLL